MAVQRRWLVLSLRYEVRKDKILIEYCNPLLIVLPLCRLASCNQTSIRMLRGWLALAKEFLSGSFVDIYIYIYIYPALLPMCGSFKLSLDTSMAVPTWRGTVCELLKKIEHFCSTCLSVTCSCNSHTSTSRVQVRSK
jgi:hypothetical protein